MFFSATTSMIAVSPYPTFSWLMLAWYPCMTPVFSSRFILLSTVTVDSPTARGQLACRAPGVAHEVLHYKLVLVVVSFVLSRLFWGFYGFGHKQNGRELLIILFGVASRRASTCAGGTAFLPWAPPDRSRRHRGLGIMPPASLGAPMTGAAASGGRHAARMRVPLSR